MIAGEIFIVSGLLLSYLLDLPFGATIILVGVAAFLLVVTRQIVLDTFR